MDLIHTLIDFILHIDVHLTEIVRDYGVWTYAILFIIVFCETGLVVTPFLPGDSLLFAAGAIASKGALDPHLLFILLSVAAILGNTVNYSIGRFIGPKVFEKKNSRIFKPHYLQRTHAFFEKHGNKTLIYTRFAPILRTFAPFLAGVGQMSYKQFMVYTVIGGILWSGLFVYAGFYFGTIPFVEKNFKVVILAIIIISLIPAVIEGIKARKIQAA